MRGLLEVSWLWQMLGISLLVAGIGIACAALIQKRRGEKAACRNRGAHCSHRLCGLQSADGAAFPAPRPSLTGGRGVKNHPYKKQEPSFGNE